MPPRKTALKPPVPAVPPLEKHARHLQVYFGRQGLKLELVLIEPPVIRARVTPSEESVPVDLTITLHAGRPPLVSLTEATPEVLNTAEACVETWYTQTRRWYDAYVDGSYLDGAVGYGAVVLDADTILKEFHGAVPPDFAEDTRQVAGELVAVGKVIKWCEAEGIPNIRIHYDYLGIECWATGAWKANKSLTQRYAESMARTYICVEFVKVKAHSGVFWNDRADELAREGALQGRTSGTVASKAGGPGTARPDTTVDTEALRTAERTAHTFAYFLNDRHIDAHFDRTYNNQYARLLVRQGASVVGYLDIYNTVKKPLTLRAHTFQNERFAQQLEALWEQFRTAGAVR